MPLPRANLQAAAASPNYTSAIATMGQVAQSVRFTAPVGGWDVLDSIVGMDPSYALTLDNMFPTVRDVHVRGGYTLWASGMSGQVETLMQWGARNTHPKMLAANQGNIYDVTNAGAVGAPLATGYSNNRWQYVNIGTPGGQFLWACNGLDTPWAFDGTNVTPMVITGVTSTSIVNVGSFKERLFFVISNSLSYAYLPIQSIQGAALTVDLSAWFHLGGYLVAIGTWSRAGLTDQDDLCVFLTNKGEFVIFQGSDPGDATNWSLVNRGRVGAPVGYRCMTKIGSDLYIVGQDGLVALSEVLWLDRVDVSKTISEKIGLAITNAVQLYGSNFGWQIFLYPRGNYVAVNVPLAEGTIIQQYVANTGTGSWCRFLNQNANCWELYNENPYFGGIDGNVYQADNGTSDNGNAITFEARTAFNDMGIPGQNKQWTFVRPIMTAGGQTNIAYDFEVDYNMEPILSSPIPSTPEGAEWDVGLWDSALWGSGSSVQQPLLNPNAIGRVGAFHMKGASKDQSVSWQAIDYIFIEAGLI